MSQPSTMVVFLPLREQATRSRGMRRIMVNSYGYLSGWMRRERSLIILLDEKRKPPHINTGRLFLQWRRWFLCDQRLQLFSRPPRQGHSSQCRLIGERRLLGARHADLKAFRKNFIGSLWGPALVRHAHLADRTYHPGKKSHARSLLTL